MDSTRSPFWRTCLLISGWSFKQKWIRESTSLGMSCTTKEAMLISFSLSKLGKCGLSSPALMMIFSLSWKSILISVLGRLWIRWGEVGLPSQKWKLCFFRSTFEILRKFLRRLFTINLFWKCRPSATLNYVQPIDNVVGWSEDWTECSPKWPESRRTPWTI